MYYTELEFPFSSILGNQMNIQFQLFYLKVNELIYLTNENFKYLYHILKILWNTGELIEKIVELILIIILYLQED